MLNLNLKPIKESLRNQKIYGLRQTIQQIRDNDESFQYELFKVAQAKGYYTSAIHVKQTEIDQVKNEVSN